MQIVILVNLVALSLAHSPPPIIANATIRNTIKKPAYTQCIPVFGNVPNGATANDKSRNPTATKKNTSAANSVTSPPHPFLLIIRLLC